MVDKNEDDIDDLKLEVHRLQRAIKTLTDQLDEASEQNRSLERQLSAHAQVDIVTKASSLRVLLEAMETEHVRSHRYNTPYAIMSLEIANFINIVEVHGHVAADKALAHIVGLARKCMRDGVDIIGRNGHQEFCIVLPQTDELGARQCAQRIRQMANENPLIENNLQVSIAPLFGIASYSGEVELNSSDVQNRARGARGKARKEDPIATASPRNVSNPSSRLTG